ncbi:MAG: hypothetical protein QNJ55_32685 [Xenococcus sp. MO_188.B8]|nr:hypothetical protein [Xenococcus sp. MO_188.B8]
MSNNNGNGQYLTKTQQRGEAIDQLLKGRSDTIKANVLSYIVKFNMNPNHEFFIIFVALGTLETLIETSPQEWQELFKGFQGELETWSNTNQETLNLISEKARITERLASNSESLANTLTKFLEASAEQTSQLREVNTLLTNFQSQSQTSLTKLKESTEKSSNRFSQLESEVKKLNLTIENQSKSNPLNKKGGVWKDNLLIGLITIVLLTTGYFGFTQHRVNQSTNQRVQWLLEKANRIDCRMGIKKPGSPECKGF